MTAAATPNRKRVPLTQFHNATGEFLDLAMRTPIVLTSHGRPKQFVGDNDYVERLEHIARIRIISALDLEVHPASAMPPEMRQRILDTQPTPEEIMNDRWNDEL
jgi:hypothetical protein